MIKNTLQNISRKPQIGKSYQLENSASNMYIVGENLVGNVLQVVFFYGFMFQIISEKTLRRKIVTV